MVWVTLLVMSFAPIALLSIYSERVASDSIRNLIVSEDLARTGNIAMQLQQDIGRTIALAEAVGTSATTSRLIKDEDVLGIVTRLKALTVAFPAIQSASILDREGSVQYQYPAEKGLQKSSSLTKLAASVVTSKKPSVSPMQQAGSGRVAVVSAPVQGNGTEGVVSLTYRSEQVKHWLEGIDLPKDESMLVLDQRGIVIAANGSLGVQEGASYTDIPSVRHALNGTLTIGEFDDPVTGRRVVATMVPLSLGRSTWVVVTLKDAERAFSDLGKIQRNIGMAGGTLTLITLMMIVMIARIHRRNLKLTETLEENNLKLGEAAAIVETSNDAIIGFGRDGRIRTWNRAAERMYGYSAESIVGDSITTIIPKDRSDEFANILSSVTAGQTLQHYETKRRRKDGSLIPVSMTVSPVRSADGSVEHVSTIDRDITERLRVEQMKDDFISFVSHQLKAPLTAVRWTLESIESGDYGPIPDALKTPLGELRDVNVQNYHLVTDILNASRIDRGVIAVELQSVKMQEILERSLRDYRSALQRAGLTLTVRDDAEGLTVNADLEKAAEAITNSISNAIKHTKKGGLTIRMYTDGAFGCLSVTDTGEGMPKEIIDKLFTRSGILGTNTMAEKSAGLGLYIARHFMELQGGDISVESEPGKGTTFTYRLRRST